MKGSVWSRLEQKKHCCGHSEEVIGGDGGKGEEQKRSCRSDGLLSGWQDRAAKMRGRRGALLLGCWTGARTGAWTELYPFMGEDVDGGRGRRVSVIKVLRVDIGRRCLFLAETA
jgi:hypothetical protein